MKPLTLAREPDAQAERAPGPMQAPRFDIAMAAACYLMTRYAALPDPRVAMCIAEHLTMVATHPDCPSPTLAQAGQRLSLTWRGMAVETRPQINPH